MNTKSFLATSILLHLIVIGYSQSPSWQWAFGFGGEYKDRSESITRDNSGNLIVTGQFRDVVDFDPGPNDFTMYANSADVFILKTDSNKNFIWAKQIGYTGVDYGTNIINDDSSNLYVTGLFQGAVDFDPGPGIFTMTAPVRGFFILKLDSSGTFQWAKSIYGSASNFLEVNRIRRDEDCNFYLGGYFKDTIDFDPGVDTFLVGNDGHNKVFILKLNSQGEFNWIRVLGSPFNTINSTLLQDMDVNSSGEIVLTGYFQYELDLDPGPDTLLLDAQIGHDAFISKLDSGGNFQWGFNYGNNDYLLGHAIAFDSSNNVIAAGSFSSSFDADPGPPINLVSSVNPSANYLVRLNSSGDYIWSQVVENSAAYGIACDAQNNLYVSGVFSDTTDFNPDPGLNNVLYPNGQTDVFIFKSDSNGFFNWVAKAGGQGWEQTSRAVLGSNDDIYLTGQFIGASANFGSLTIQNASTFPGVYVDCYMARLHNLQTGLNELPPASILNIFPNPAVSVINVIINHPAEINICDLMGKELFNKQFSSGGKTQVEFEISSLASGVYIIKAGNLVRKIVKM